MDILNDITTWSILKWVIIVLVAGFIGQFGKTTAQAVMRKIRPKKIRESDSPPANTSGTPASPMDTAPNKNKSTFLSDKKTLKTISKQQKKAAKLITKVK
jgi:hypothetical protein